jgi:hypothetical protein
MADTFRLARSTFIQAPPATVHALVNDFHEWEKWSPWVKMDAGRLSQTYEGPSSGVGAGYTWVGPKTGKGRMEILASTPAHIGVALDFIAPMKRNNKADFTFTPEAGGTKVEWAMTGPMGLFDKIMQMFFSMEKMVGPSFEQGLAGIKALAEAAAPKAEPTPKPAAAPVAVAAPKAPAASKAVAPKTPAKPNAQANPKTAAKTATPKAKPAAKPAAVKGKAAPVAKAAQAKTAPAKAEAAKAAPKAKPAAKVTAPAAKASAAPKAKAAPAQKTAAKAKPAAKPKAPAKKT